VSLTFPFLLWNIYLHAIGSVIFSHYLTFFMDTNAYGSADYERWKYFMRLLSGACSSILVEERPPYIPALGTPNRTVHCIKLRS
jgi:hypothetical protein